MTSARLNEPCSLRGLLIFLSLFLPVSAAAAQGARTLAVVDFAVRVAPSESARNAWLGPAVSELLQAKMQLFDGARVLDRSRVRALLDKATVAPSAGEPDPASFAELIPAHVLIAGSVGIDPKDSHRIRVQARAFETETGKILSEAAFTGVTDLAGLLGVAEELARGLADGLKLAYTPEQLAYAEPAGIDTLQSYVEGEEHLAAGRHREAITAFQKALEGNQGRYYAAAHRLQGEAYQALVKSSAAEGERAVREEYLRKFKEDALAAAGAIYDLALGYEANGMLKEAVETFEDYLKAIDRAGETVRWSRSIDTYGWLREKGTISDWALEDGRLYVLAGAKLTILDAETGQPMLEGFPLKIGYGRWHLAGVENGVLYVVWEGRGLGGSEDRGFSGTVYAAALGPDQKPLWERQIIEGQAELSRAWMAKGLIYVDYQDVLPSRRIGDHHLLTMDREGGERSRFALPAAPLDMLRYRNWEPDLEGFDPWSATLALEDGLYDLSGGRLLRTWETREQPVSRPFRGPRASYPLDLRKIERPTGLPGIVYTQERDGLHLHRDGREMLFLKGSSIFRGLPSGADVPHLLFDSPEGYLLVDPALGTTVTLYGDLQPEKRPRLLASGKNWLAFGLRIDPRAGTPDHRYTLPAFPTHSDSEVLNLVEVPGGRLLAKYQLPELGLKGFFMGSDLFLVSREQITRISPWREGVVVVPAAEARLHIAEDLVAAKDLTGALRSLERFEAEYPRDPRSALVRMKLSTANGMPQDAAVYAVKVLSSGLLSQAEVGPCVDAIHAVYPFVKDAIVTPAKQDLNLVSMAGPGIIVAARRAGDRLGTAHLLIDAATKTAKSLPTPDMRYGIYDGPVVYGGSEGNRLLRFDPLTGAKVFSDPVKTHLQHDWSVAGLPSTVHRKRSRDENGRSWDLQAFDPDTLTPGALITDVSEAFVGNGRATFANTGWWPDAELPVVVLDQETLEEVARVRLRLRNEEIRSATADRDLLVVAVAGADIDVFRHGGRGTWLRVEAYPLGSNGARWTYEAAGWLGGNVVIEEDGVSFPAFEGTLGPEVVHQEDVAAPPVRPGGAYPLRRITVERLSGRRRGESPLQTLPGKHYVEGRDDGTADNSRTLCDKGFAGRFLSPQGPLRIFPGNKQAIWDEAAWSFHTTDYWFLDPDKPPVKSWVQGRERDYRVYVEKDPRLSLGLVWKDTVFESIGGGVILVKDLAKGEGLKVVHFIAGR